ncbi:hypothetical protein ABW19_dt0203334 [Dactylella cylindrospora]|nr:hypothetical protein ABW19_dt0203334 [Dactylella cylindrospora]
MGGSAFSTRNLSTPRMSPETYNRLKAQFHEILTGLFAHVTTPPEAPGKTSYGDIDFLVAGPLPQDSIKVLTGKKGSKGSRQPSPSPDQSDAVLSKPQPKGRKVPTETEHIKLAFNAEDTVKSGATTSFAVPRVATSSDSENEGKKVYAQVDVHICSTEEAMRWLSFKHAYGDMWSILGMMARAKGLVADEHCLSIVVPEIEPRDRKLSKVEITRDVNETLEFFGLDVEAYGKGFEKVDEVYEFIRNSRFCEEKYFKEKGWSRTKDRRKTVKREMMKGFFVYLGASPPGEEEEEEAEEAEEEGGKEEKLGEGNQEEEEEEEEAEDIPEKITRAEVLEEALEKFGKRAAYEEKVTKWRRSEKANEIIGMIVKSLLEGEYCSMKSARRRASKLRRRINSGELEQIYEMSEEEVLKFVEEYVEVLVKEIQSKPVGVSDDEEEEMKRKAKGVNMEGVVKRLERFDIVETGKEA